MTQAIRICVQALSVVGGLGVSMFLTLLVIPCVYLIISGAAERSKAAHGSTSCPSCASWLTVC